MAMSKRSKTRSLTSQELAERERLAKDKVNAKLAARDQMLKADVALFTKAMELEGLRTAGVVWTAAAIDATPLQGTFSPPPNPWGAGAYATFNPAVTYPTHPRRTYSTAEIMSQEVTDLFAAAGFHFTVSQARHAVELRPHWDQQKCYVADMTNLTQMLGMFGPTDPRGIAMVIVHASGLQAR